MEPKTTITDIWERSEQFNGKIDVGAIVAYARSQKATGDLIFKLHDGGIRGAVLVKKISADLDLSDTTESDRRRLGL